MLYLTKREKSSLVEYYLMKDICRTSDASITNKSTWAWMLRFIRPIKSCKQFTIYNSFKIWHQYRDRNMPGNWHGVSLRYRVISIWVFCIVKCYWNTLRWSLFSSPSTFLIVINGCSCEIKINNRNNEIKS